ncbi:uncharacterized protein C9orf85 homolog [Dunckerocampus dactyliophorus]|uniref:uncharacterized protein C9orf85 homolog n=1 Tax=Dunckerocampus dactyliophorus TaxID=161453 RepID=UPI002404A48B|nr:uncharacterized protein C9orf85 homolog [Dunckerocampus dactyliophorus]
MSSQKGNVSRSRGQRHQNTTAFKNDKYGATAQVKKAQSKIHDGLCQHCKGVLEWKVKYNKYKTLTQPRKCVKCSQKTVKDAYHVICKPCSLQLDICCKCGKKEDIVIPVNSHLGQEEKEEKDGEYRGKMCRKMDMSNLDSDDDYDEGDHEDNEDCDSNSMPKKTHNKSAPLPDMSGVNIAN